MTTTQPVDVRATADYKVGAAKTTVDTLLAGTYGPLTPAQVDALDRLRAVLYHGDPDQPTRTCGVYGWPRGECRLPLGHWPTTPHDLTGATR